MALRPYYHDLSLSQSSTSVSLGVATSIYTFRPALMEEANARAGSVPCSSIIPRSPFPVAEPIGILRIDSSSNSNAQPDGKGRDLVPASTPSTDSSSHEEVKAMEGSSVKSDAGSKAEDL